MSAVYDGSNVFYISNNERVNLDHHAALSNHFNGRGHFARVIRESPKVCLVVLNECNYCDKVRSDYSCGYNTGTREIIAKVVNVCTNIVVNIYSIILLS